MAHHRHTTGTAAGPRPTGDGNAASVRAGRGTARARLSTTVDTALLQGARKVSGKPDSAMVDDALAALLARHRPAEVGAGHAAHDAHPPDEPDAWGDLESFRT